MRFFKLARIFFASISELHKAGALRRAGKIEDAQKILASLKNLTGQSAEYHYQRGSVLASDGELAQASAEFEKALSLDRDHTGALFELAYINDLYGNDETAVDYYTRCTQRPPVPLAALINLGVASEHAAVVLSDVSHDVAADVAGGARVTYDDQAQKAFPNGDILLNGNWDTPVGHKIRAAAP